MRSVSGPTDHVVVVGAGLSGLSSALHLLGAGRRVTIMGRLRTGEPALKKAEVVDIVPKTGRSGDIFVLTMRNTYEQGGKTVAVDEADAIYRPAVPPGQKTTATVATKARTEVGLITRTGDDRPVVRNFVKWPDAPTRRSPRRDPPRRRVR